MGGATALLQCPGRVRHTVIGPRALIEGSGCDGMVGGSGIAIAGRRVEHHATIYASGVGVSCMCWA